MGSQNYDEAVERFSTILSLVAEDRTDTLIKRSKARAAMRSWDDAVGDADEVYMVSWSQSMLVTERTGHRTRPIFASRLRTEVRGITRRETLCGSRGGIGCNAVKTGGIPRRTCPWWVTF